MMYRMSPAHHRPWMLVMGGVYCDEYSTVELLELSLQKQDVIIAYDMGDGIQMHVGKASTYLKAVEVYRQWWDNCKNQPLEDYNEQ